jgi:hypothetical protein
MTLRKGTLADLDPLRAQHAAPLSLTATTADAWDQHLPLLRSLYPMRDFLPGFATDL